MQRFQFRLETLLKYRKMQTDEAQVKFSQATAAWLAEKEKLATLKVKQADHEALLRESRHKPVAVEFLAMCYQYSEILKSKIVRQTISVENARKARQECLDRLTAAMRKQKLVEKLKDKRLAEYQTELLHLEQKELDEIGLQRYVRNE